MRQSIKALGWASTISMIILFVFLATALFSMYETILTERGLRLGNYQSQFSGDTLVLSMPFAVNNSGYYDISDFDLRTSLKDANSTILATNGTFVPGIKSGSSHAGILSVSLSLVDLFSNKTYLLFKDSELKIDVYMGLKYASALAFHLTMMNNSMPWGAPLHGLFLKEVRPISLNGTDLELDASLELENHSYFYISGDLCLKIYNEKGIYLGLGRGTFSLPPRSTLSEVVAVHARIENISDFTGKGSVKSCLEIPAYNYTKELEGPSYG